jgi:uncharacterized alkaline shock family protein YloU
MSTAAPHSPWTEPTPSRRPDRAEPTTDPNRPAVGRHHLVDPAEDRGRTTIDDRVIEAMAARIASEQPGVGGAARRVLGVPMSSEDIERAPRVEVTAAGEVVSLRVRLSLTYPEPVRQATDRIRHRLIDKVGELTGKRVAVVDVVVAALHRPARPGRIVR